MLTVPRLAVQQLAIRRMTIELLLRHPLSLRLQLFLQLRLSLLLFLGQLLGLLQRLALGLGLEARPFRPRLSALLLALLLARVAFAADRLQIGFEIVRAVVIVDLLARLDVLDGAN